MLSSRHEASLARRPCLSQRQTHRNCCASARVKGRWEHAGLKTQRRDGTRDELVQDGAWPAGPVENYGSVLRRQAQGDTLRCVFRSGEQIRLPVLRGGGSAGSRRSAVDLRTPALFEHKALIHAAVPRIDSGQYEKTIQVPVPMIAAVFAR